MSKYQVIKNVAYCLAHVPELVRYGSKPRREIGRDPAQEANIGAALRSYGQAVSYPPNQTFIGNLSPEQLVSLPRPWFTNTADPETTGLGLFGEIAGTSKFYDLLQEADVLSPPLLTAGLTNGLPLYLGEELVASFQGDERAEGCDDENLADHNLLENLCTKASGVLALRWLLKREGIEPGDIDFVISCGEEACGDRYQRGGGGMAKAMAEMCGCENASGLDLKNFCAAPASALIVAASLVGAGVHQRIAVVGGGSLAKLGMKYQAFVEHGMPILDDCLASMAFLVTADDGQSPIIHLGSGAVGKVPVAAGTTDEQVFRHYLLAPLENLGLALTDIDRFAPELQNPEIMEFAGSGDVAKKNYRKIAAMAVMTGLIEKKDMADWIDKVGMTGFAPTQGHIPSAVPYLGHAVEAMKKGEIKRAMFLARASIFLNRCTNLLDGVSFVLEKNSGDQAEK
jgi:betaine reductase